MTSSKAPGTVITFYSYKGGTGRSMALANTAWILASNTKRVLTLDWDLEAPGLHRYFCPFLRDKELTASEGIIDFVIDMAVRSATREKRVQDDWFVPFADFQRYAVSLQYRSNNFGTIDFVPAGLQGPDYATRVNSFDWNHFYNTLSGGVFLEAARTRALEYDYVLIDSRTGVSDTSGICTVHLPDIVVVCFTLNRQSIEGAAAVAESAQQQRVKPDGSPGLRIFPVPTRVERSESSRVHLARQAAVERFDRFLWHLEPAARKTYWEQIEVPYQPYYAHEEVLAVFGDETAAEGSILASMQTLVRSISSDPGMVMPPMPVEDRSKYLAQFLRQPPAPVQQVERLKPTIEVQPPQLEKPSPPLIPSSTRRAPYCYISYAKADMDRDLARCIDDLKIAVHRSIGHVVNIFDPALIEAGTDWRDAVLRAVSTARVFVPLLSPAYVNSESCGKELQLFLSRVAADERKMGIVPLVWAPLRQVPRVLRDYQLRPSGAPQGYVERGLRSMLRLRQTVEYKVVLDQLSESIVREGRRSPLKPLESAPSFESTRNAFLEDAAETTTVNVVYFTGTESEMRKARTATGVYGPMPWSWNPWRSNTIGSVMQQVLAKWRYWEVKANTLGTFLERSTSETILLVAVDPWALKLPQFIEWAKLLDPARLHGSILVVHDRLPDSEAARPELTQRVKLSFARWFGLSRYALGDVASEDDLGVRTQQVVEAFTAELYTSRAARRSPPPVITGP